MMNRFVARRGRRWSLLFLGFALPAAVVIAADPGPFPGVRSQWNGYDRYDFACDGRKCILVTPKKAAPGKPWIWRARFFGHEPQVDLTLLARGFHLAYMDVVEMYGNPAAVAHWNAFYQELTTRQGLARRVALEGMSRGGLYIYNWAAANPEKVACIYADAPVCDIHSWAKRKDQSPATARFFADWLKSYGLTEDQLADYRGNPIDRLEPLSRAGVPLLHVVGDADDVVPVAENTAILETRYRKLGGHIEVIHKPEVGHHPHSLTDPTPIVDFIVRYAEVREKGAGLFFRTKES
ncbi:MAG: prolyl oligopeptidase family serine peptidase [Candidatus Anammoximicrobium sp.]|nr:prolyl oligopeptidase family serine peptidase [Candidatus Anammoximicrobium sp.]